MRLWHKDLIPVLPRKQLISQWRECCAIARNIAVNGTPNHLLVNKVLDYPIMHFITYAENVSNECFKRGYIADWNRIDKWLPAVYDDGYVPNSELFKDWHNERYLLQCWLNLQEKYDCGGMTDEEYDDVLSVVWDKCLKGKVK